MPDNISDNPLFQSLSPTKREVIEDVISASSGLPLEKALPIILKANLRLKKQGESFTKEESSLLITEITKKLSPQERAKVASLLKLL